MAAKITVMRLLEIFLRNVQIVEVLANLIQTHEPHDNKVKGTKRIGKKYNRMTIINLCADFTFTGICLLSLCY